MSFAFVVCYPEDEMNARELGSVGIYGARERKGWLRGGWVHNS